LTVVTLSSKYQISVPKEVRDALNLKAGQKLVFINTGTSIKLMAQPTIDDLAGIARDASTEGVRDRDERRLEALPRLKAPGKRRAKAASASK